MAKTIFGSFSSSNVREQCMVHRSEQYAGGPAKLMPNVSMSFLGATECVIPDSIEITRITVWRSPRRPAPRPLVHPEPALGHHFYRSDLLSNLFLAPNEVRSYTISTTPEALVTKYAAMFCCLELHTSFRSSFGKNDGATIRCHGQLGEMGERGRADRSRGGGKLLRRRGSFSRARASGHRHRRSSHVCTHDGHPITVEEVRL